MPDFIMQAASWLAEHPTWSVAAAIGAIVYSRFMRA
jgi:hypothetical protein